MTIKNPQGIGRALVRVRSVQLPGKTEIEYIDREVVKEVEVIKEVPVSNLTAEIRAEKAERNLADALATIERMKTKPVAEKAIEQNGKEGPPADIQHRDVVDALDIAAEINEGEVYGDNAEAIAKAISKLENKRFLKIYSDADGNKYERLKKALVWFEARGAIEVV